MFFMKPTLENMKVLSEDEQLKEVEVMLTLDELKKFGEYCTRHHIKFNDWIRRLAHEALTKELRETNV
jgi:hypothetical protein